MRQINEIIIHCSATREGMPFTAADIDRWHKQIGWKGIGYHFVVRLDGTIEAGRPIDQEGAHCSGHNKTTIGVCYIGGCDEQGKAKDTRTVEQRVALRSLVKSLCVVFQTIKKVSGHNQYSNKACPCFDVRKEYNEI